MTPAKMLRLLALCTLLTIWPIYAQASLFDFQEQTVALVDEQGVVRGSGIVLADDRAITALHLIKWARQNVQRLTVTWMDGTERQILVERAFSNGLDLIEIWFDPVVGAVRADVRCTKLGTNESVETVANILGRRWLVIRGSIVGFDLRSKDGSTILIQMLIAPGASGSGLFDQQGRLVGILSGVVIVPLMQWQGPPWWRPFQLVGLATAVPSTHLCEKKDGR